MKIYRQGDVLLQAVKTIPADAAEVTVVGDVVLAYGEVTGHAHRIAAGATPYAKGGIWSATAERYIAVAERAALTHEEHDTIVLPAGRYRVIQQREYHPEKLRNVAD